MKASLTIRFPKKAFHFIWLALVITSVGMFGTGCTPKIQRRLIGEIKAPAIRYSFRFHEHSPYDDWRLHIVPNASSILLKDGIVDVWIKNIKGKMLYTTSTEFAMENLQEGDQRTAFTGKLSTLLSGQKVVSVTKVENQDVDVEIAVEVRGNNGADSFPMKVYMEYLPVFP